MEKGAVMASVFENNGGRYTIDGVEVSQAEWEARFARQRQEEEEEAEEADEQSESGGEDQTKEGR